MGLSAKAKAFSVKLTWSTAGGGDAVHGYRLYREGVLIQSIDGAVREDIDETAYPGHSYLYELESVGVGGAISARASVEVKTPTPPLSVARVDGDFRLTFKPVSRFGYNDLGRTHTIEWRLRPKCNEGACDIVLTDPRGARFVLHRDGAEYSGGTSVRFLANCQGTPSTSSLTVTFRVIEAEAINREWRATAVKGTMTNREAAQGICMSSGSTFSLSGKLL